MNFIKQVLKGRYQAIVLSIILHVLLLLWIINSASSVPHIPPVKHEAIKSYLYQAKPVELEVVAPVIPPAVEPSIKEQPKKIENETNKETIEQVAKTQEVTQVNKEQKAQEEQPRINYPVKKQEATPVIPKNFSASGQMDKLRNRINQSMIEKEQADFLQFKSPSVMHGEPTPVPHAEIKLTPQQKKEQNTTRYADGIAITKNDNGTCTTELDLSNVGMEGHSALLLSACGESKFDKSFREHMKKVSDKLK